MGSAFRKVRPRATRSYYEAEAAGLDWIRVAGGPPVPAVLSMDADGLNLQRINEKGPTPEAAAMFGRALATLHSCQAPSFGSAPSSAPRQGWIADLPMEYGDFDSFGSMYAELRIRPYVDLGRSSGQFDLRDALVFERLCGALVAGDEQLVGPSEPAARLHGDLWSGNLLWAPDDDGVPSVWLIDPAAYGGHRESDLAMLQLFGVPYLAQILAAYEDRHPLTEGWQRRVSLHQIYPLLIHAVLFGGGYGPQALAAAKRALAEVG